jgi:hypothetical protein
VVTALHPRNDRRERERFFVFIWAKYLTVLFRGEFRSIAVISPGRAGSFTFAKRRLVEGMIRLTDLVYGTQSAEA